MLGVVAAGLAALLAIGVVLWAGKGTDADNVVSVRAVEDSEHRVIYLEEYSVFVVATDGGPIALMDGLGTAETLLWEGGFGGVGEAIGLRTTRAAALATWFSIA